ncbi:hypothetical protein VTN00DRAFT_8293 [Thermoascus crustaceus]|uniref:uncharacterized protein n=1 Tax=Thermoascus crustaceus TaxID=5088 RepID=UPI003742CA11
MASQFVSSPSSSPDLCSLPLSFPQSYDTNSDSSSPGSPASRQMLYHAGLAGTYDLLPFDKTQAPFFSNTNIRADYAATNTTAAHEQDRRQRTSIPKDKEVIASMHLRRRAQNRASQRAFRERKEKHVKNLESQLQTLHERHQDLLQSYSRQADEVTRLNEKIKELTTEIDLLRNSSNSSGGGDSGMNNPTEVFSTSTSGGFSDLMLMPDRFDAVPYPDMIYRGPESYFDSRDAMRLNTDSTFAQWDDRL